MTRREAQSEFGKWFGPFFERHGFRARRWNLFERKSNDLLQRISIGPVARARGGFSLTGGGFGVHIPAIEAIRGREAEASTLGMPLHMIAPGTEVRHEWFVTNVDEVALAAREIQPAIEAFGLPYLAELSSFEAVVERLEGDNWPKWFASSQDGRDSLLVYAEVVSKGRDEALALGRQLLTKYEGLPYNRSLLLTEAIARCESVRVEPKV